MKKSNSNRRLTVKRKILICWTLVLGILLCGSETMNRIFRGGGIVLSVSIFSACAQKKKKNNRQKVTCQNNRHKVVRQNNRQTLKQRDLEQRNYWMMFDIDSCFFFVCFPLLGYCSSGFSSTRNIGNNETVTK